MSDGWQATDSKAYDKNIFVKFGAIYFNARYLKSKASVVRQVSTTLIQRARFRKLTHSSFNAITSISDFHYLS